MKPSSHWETLRRDLILATAEPGARSALAKSIGVTRSAVTQWLSEGGTTPTAETALRLYAWVHPDEAEKQSPGRVSPRPEPKTLLQRSKHENQSQARKKQ